MTDFSIDRLQQREDLLHDPLVSFMPKPRYELALLSVTHCVEDRQRQQYKNCQGAKEHNDQRQ